MPGGCRPHRGNDNEGPGASRLIDEIPAISFGRARGRAELNYRRDVELKRFPDDWADYSGRAGSVLTNGSFARLDIDGLYWFR